MKKGFTLVELLAVIILLSAIMFIVIPTVNNSIKNSKNSLSSVQIKNIEKAAEQYYLSEGMNNNKTCVSVNELLEKGYLDSDKIKNPKDNTEIIGSVTYRYQNQRYKYTYNEGPCAICETLAGDGTNIGDKLSCEVKPGTKYNFYVLSKENDGTTNLMMDSNICSDGTVATKSKTCNVAWISEVDYGCGNIGDCCSINDKPPITSMNQLNEATSSWSNINNLNITYTDEEGSYGTLSITGKARMLYKREAYEAGCEDYSELSCPVWMTENLSNEIYGYWTLSSRSEYPMSVWQIIKNGYIGSNAVNTNGYYGVRPVINVSNNDIAIGSDSKYICNPVDENTVTTGNIPEGYFESGDEYICEVKSLTNYHFFVLSTEGDKVNLIMNRNICNDGTFATEDNTCPVAYNSSGNLSGSGPVTAMNYLNDATSTWNNIPNLDIIYNDEGGHFTYELTGKARLPYKIEVADYDESNGYLYDYLNQSNKIQKNPINGIYGYWLFSSYEFDTVYANLIIYNGDVYYNFIGIDSSYGVRPVISLSKNSIK